MFESIARLTALETNSCAFIPNCTGHRIIHYAKSLRSPTFSEWKIFFFFFFLLQACCFFPRLKQLLEVKAFFNETVVKSAAQYSNIVPSFLFLHSKSRFLGHWQNMESRLFVPHNYFAKNTKADISMDIHICKTFVSVCFT